MAGTTAASVTAPGCTCCCSSRAARMAGDSTPRSRVAARRSAWAPAPRCHSVRPGGKPRRTTRLRRHCCSVPIILLPRMPDRRGRRSGRQCYVSRANTGGIKGGLGLAEDKVEAPIACRQTGAISFPKPIKRQDAGLPDPLEPRDRRLTPEQRHGSSRGSCDADSGASARGLPVASQQIGARPGGHRPGAARSFAKKTLRSLPAAASAKPSNRP